jgi:hypothetical protein
MTETDVSICDLLTMVLTILPPRFP